MCVTCHHEAGPASAKLDFGLHLTPGYAADDVDCGSCHELHNPNGATTSTHTLAPFTTTTNKKFIRSNVDKYVSTATPGNVAIYQTPIDDLAIEDGDGSTARGICQSCHTQVANYRHDGTGDQCHDGGAGNCDPITNGGTDCLGCHTHTGNFGASGGGCTGCHSSAQGGAPPLDRREIVSEFSRLTHHVGGTLADSDCEVCHQQTSASPSHTHQDGALTLWDVDRTADTDPGYQLANHSDPNTNATEAAKLTTFCLNCHDSDGAQAEASPFAPFTGSGAPKDIASTWSGSSHATISQQSLPDGSGDPTTCFGDGAFGCHGTGHGSEKLRLLTPADSAATGPDFSEQREGFCLNCHQANGASSIDIDTILSTTITETQGLQYTTVNNKHDILPADQSFSGGVVSCNDCHSPHLDSNSNPVANPDTGLPLATYSRNNSYSGDATSFNYAWDGNDYDPTNPEGGTSIPETDYVEFCLVCHDGTAPQGVTLPGNGLLNMADVYRLDDQHGRLEGGGSASRGYMKQPWASSANYNAGNQPDQVYAALNCTLCHGAHGSGNIYNLRTSITVNGTPMTVGGKDAFMDPALCTKSCGSIDNSLPEFGSTTYVLPEQTDMSFGAWCTFCHEQSHGTADGTGCQSGHRPGGGNF